MTKRKLVEDHSKQTETKVILENNTCWIIGKVLNMIKLAVRGEAYIHKMFMDKPKISLPPPEIDAPIQLDHISLGIIPKVSAETFIEKGEHKHLLFLYYVKDNDYYSIGYCTSKKSSLFLRTEQFNTFLKRQEDPNSNSPTLKDQYFNLFDTPKIIPAKFGTDYIKSISENKKAMIIQEITILLKKNATVFSDVGYAKQDCLDICKEHDRIARSIKQGSKEKHPLTPLEVAKNIASRKNQMDAYQLKKSQINPTSTNNDNNSTS